MKVTCVKLPTLPGGEQPVETRWIGVDTDYQVISLIAQPDGRVVFHVVTDDARYLAWFDSVYFRVADGRLPSTWRARIHEDGMLELAPAAWLVDGFWERYYESDASAVDAVEHELRLLTGSDP